MERGETIKLSQEFRALEIRSVRNYTNDMLQQHLAYSKSKWGTK